MTQCLVCKFNIQPFISFGQMPVANGFLKEEEFAGEFFSELEVGFCLRCYAAQLTRLLDPERLYHDDYLYYSSTSTGMVRHFRKFAIEATSDFLQVDDPFVVEIGSNDGIMLQNFAQAGVRHLGVEPSKKVAQEAIRNGVATRHSFFDLKVAADIVEQQGQADLIYSANVISHISDIHTVISGLGKLLKDSGVFILEDPYLGDIVQKTTFDQFYDEHVFYFCASSLSNLLAQHSMEIISVAPQSVHGGSMRYVIAKQGARPVRQEVMQLMGQEVSIGLNQEETFHTLKERIYATKGSLTDLLNDLKQAGKRVVGYGATAKSTPLTNFSGIGPDLLEYITDTTPEKQGRYSPGTHIPVVSHERFCEDYPEYALLLAWNHQDEILAKETDFIKQGGKFIVYVPSVDILGAPSHP